MTRHPVLATAFTLEDVNRSLEARDPAWTPLEALNALGITPTFVSGQPDGDRLRVRYYRRIDGRLVGRVWFGPGAEGPPGHAHGGSLAAILDEAMGASAWLAGHPVLAGEITIRFRAMVRLGSILKLEAGVVDVDGRKVTTFGMLVNDDGACQAEAHGLFIQIDPAALRKRVGSGTGDAA